MVTLTADQKIRIRLKAYDHRLLDRSVKEIVETVRRTGARVSGPVLLPTIINRWTVLRSPHVDKTSREQFEMRTHKRLLDIVDPTPQTVDSLMKLDLSAGVDVEINLCCESNWLRLASFSDSRRLASRAGHAAASHTHAEPHVQLRTLRSAPPSGLAMLAIWTRTPSPLRICTIPGSGLGRLVTRRRTARCADGTQGGTHRAEGRHDPGLRRRRQPPARDRHRGGALHDPRDPDQGHPRLRRAPARLRREEEERVEARGRPVQEGERRPDAGRPRDPPREDREAPGLPGGAGAHGGGVPAGRARRRRGRLEGQGLPGRRQAARLVWGRRDPRLDVPPGAWFDRRLVGPVARLARPSPAGTYGRRAPHRAEPQRRARDARAEPGPRPRRGPRRERLPGDDPQEREADEGAAEGGGKEIVMPTVPVLDVKGQKAGTVELKGDVFGVEIRVPLLHQAVARELADRRAGTHASRGRSEVSGGGKKPWRQKGTGRARQGSIRATQWKGGGKPFGPKPRSYAQDLPRAMRREALRVAIAARIADGALSVIETLDVADGKTKSLVAKLGALGLRGEPTLLVVRELGGA